MCKCPMRPTWHADFLHILHFFAANQKGLAEEHAGKAPSRKNICQIFATTPYITVPLGRSRLREPGRACRANGPARTVCPQALIVVDCGCRLGRESFRRTYNPHGGRRQPPLSRDASRESLRNFTGRRIDSPYPVSMLLWHAGTLMLAIPLLHNAIKVARGGCGALA
jgi:hypothetical protein